MSTYRGTFVVVNCTGKTITDVQVTHHVGSDPPDSTGKIPSLAPGEATKPVKMHSKKGFACSDMWYLRFELDGTIYSKHGKQCNYLPEDAEQTCVITLGLTSYSILTPVSDPCTQNSYGSP